MLKGLLQSTSENRVLVQKSSINRKFQPKGRHVIAQT